MPTDPKRGLRTEPDMIARWRATYGNHAACSCLTCSLLADHATLTARVEELEAAYWGGEPHDLHLDWLEACAKWFVGVRDSDPRLPIGNLPEFLLRIRAALLPEGEGGES